MRKVLEFATLARAQRWEDAADLLLGYPTNRVSHRGSRCPPAPFGRTLMWSHVRERESDGVFDIAFPDDLHGSSADVRGEHIVFDRGDAVDSPPAGMGEDVPPARAMMADEGVTRVR